MALNLAGKTKHTSHGRRKKAYIAGRACVV